MRIIAGEFKGRRLDFIKSSQLRPTMDRVKESLFNVLGGYLTDKLALDLFAGCGSLGLEALSRGVEKVVFVDASKSAIHMIRKNLETLGLSKDRSEVIQTHWENAVRHLKREGYVFDLVMLDPPYSLAKVTQNVLLALSDSAIVRPASRIILEHGSKERFEDAVIAEKFQKLKEIQFGGTSLSFFEVRS